MPNTSQIMNISFNNLAKQNKIGRNATIMYQGHQVLSDLEEIIFR